MASTEQLRALRQWLSENGGYLHPDIILENTEAAGIRCRASARLEKNSRICMIPHSIALSSLNALVDDSFTVFRNRGIAPQAIGYFYLMHQYINRATSYWKPYLDTLPTPDSELLTPFWFDEQDLSWLAETDVLFTTKARQILHETHYQQAIAMLQRAQVDPTPYTCKYWSAYKAAPNGRRQTVLLDLSRSAAEDLDFPVLFPVLDTLNHHHDAHVDWSFDPGRFNVSTSDDVVEGGEVYNNYGPKGNDDLLLGYGFCIPSNPNDKVLLVLKAPPEHLQPEIRQIQPGYFDSSGQWSREKATFALHKSAASSDNPADIFLQMPSSLLELLTYTIRHGRRLPFELTDHVLHSLVDKSSPSRHYLPHITRMIVSFLAPKLDKIKTTTPAAPPSNKRQEIAKIYRDSQVVILESVMDNLRHYLRSMLRISFQHPDPLPDEPFITTIEGLIELLGRIDIEAARKFANGVVANAGTSDLDQLREAGWEEDIFVLLLCYCQLTFGFILPEFCVDRIAEVEDALYAVELEQAQDLLQLVHTAAAANSSSIWTHRDWSAKFIAKVGGRMLVHESFPMMVPVSEGHELPRPVIYIHGIDIRS
ncbi:hypothetical protein CERZMDRAFT_110085 [Cercospora zeae-maydis SCOH1-5]|uniref:Uncharacterized protein n=1 Tax=Cercospora zeae-maydis SCOH1-5 TaxID=717836 RepID=A0A6A6FPY1_9PEZI|nr:hypothetical protein CERZMDRAFT_110085 [Cercospora zeae-maydis SCOH1-5]